MKSYSIYENPTDYPGKFVVRGWTTSKANIIPDKEITGEPVDTIHEARQFIPKGLYPTLPTEDDDDVIVEVWI